MIPRADTSALLMAGRSINRNSMPRVLAIESTMCVIIVRIHLLANVNDLTFEFINFISSKIYRRTRKFGGAGGGAGGIENIVGDARYF